MIDRLIKKHGLDTEAKDMDKVFKRYFLYNALRVNNAMTYEQIGELFNRHHSVVMRGIDRHNKLSTKKHKTGVIGDQDYLSAIYEIQIEYDNLFSNSNKYEQAFLRGTGESSAEDQGWQIAADSGAGESPYSKGCAQ